MKVDFEDGSYIEFTTNDGGLYITMSGKKQDGSFTHSSSFISKLNALSLVKFLLNWLDK